MGFKSDSAVARDALGENEELFRVLANTSLTAIFLVQNDRFVYANPAAQDIMGYSYEEFLAMETWKPIRPDYQDELKSCCQSLHSGMPVQGQFEVEFVKKTGETGWAILTAASTLYKGELACVVSGLDITKRKRAEDAMMESEEKFRVLTETSRAAVLLVQDSTLKYATLPQAASSGIRRPSFYV